MTTEIVVANRSGLAQAPDGSKHRLVRGRTLADVRHPLAQEHPDLFSPYKIDLPYEGDDASPAAVNDASEVAATAEGYRAQLAAIAEGLHTRGLVPADVDMTREGWLAELVFAALDAEPSPADEAAGATAPEVSPDRPRKRAPRRAAPRPAVTDAEE